MFYFLKRKLVELLILVILFNSEVRISYGSIVRTTAEYNGPNSPSSGITELNVKRPSPGGSGEIMKSTSLNLNEPSCEELRAMWQFSRRQSRASEITNEIPTYHDPFNVNVWDPYYPTTTRSLGGRRVSSRYRANGRPVYGRIVHHQPNQPNTQIGGRYYDVPTNMERSRLNYEDFLNIKPYSNTDNMLLGNQQQQNAKNMRKQQKVRFGNGITGGNSISSSPNLGQHAIFGSTGLNQIAPQRGSFQRLKELVWTERARELSQQRKNEEIAARAAILKDITNGQHYKTSSSSLSPTSSRRTSKNGQNNNKNKLLKDENKGLNNKDDMQQFIPYSSLPYWSNENVKRSSQLRFQQIAPNKDQLDGMVDSGAYPSESDFRMIKDYFNDGSGLIDNDVKYFDDDNGIDYDVNGFFNSINDDNINDFYFYINQLLGKKPNQKSI